MGNAWPLVGRDGEIAAIADAINDDAIGGVILTGPAGVGKTRLAREALAAAEQLGRRTRWVAATASAQPVPLGTFAPFAPDFGPDPMRRVAEVVEAMIGTDPSVPSVVAVDDAHLLDEQSALVLQHILRDGIAPILITLRTGESAPDSVDSLLQNEGLVRIEVDPLTVADMAALVESVLGGEVESSSLQRLWRFTRGNVLFLRQVLDDEVAARRLTRRSGIWIWDGRLDLSPTLAELIESNIGRQGESVLNVLDLLAIADPMELPIMSPFVSDDDIAAAERSGLVTLDVAAREVHLAHPMFGEVRRKRAGSVHLRLLRARLADALEELGEPSLLQTVRRALLTLDSESDDDPALLAEAATAALQLLDLDLAVRLAESAFQCGGGRPAKELYATTLALAGRVRDSDALLAELAATASQPADRARIGWSRAINLTWLDGRFAASERALDIAEQDAAACGLTNCYNAVRASLRAATGDPVAAVEMCTRALAGGGLDPTSTMLAIWGLVIGFGDLGRPNELSAAAERGYELARTQPEASHLRFGLGMLHIAGLRLAGKLDEARAIASDRRRESQDVGLSIALSAVLMGLAEMSCGDLASARRWFREALAAGEGTGASDNIDRFAGQWSAIALAMAGDREAAEQALRTAMAPDFSELALWEHDIELAQAWVHAVRGSSSKAGQLAIRAAQRAGSLNRVAHEVMCLQTATQFGLATTAARLAVLAQRVEGPRAPAAAAHAVALRDRNGKGLLAASELYEVFGDRVASADAAAQAAVVFRKGRQHEAYVAATGLAQRLAAETGADTLALQACAAPQLTSRQREVVALAASGLSNAQIAEQLVTSIRTVEGHIFQAAQRTGVGMRAELIKLFDGHE